MNIHVIDSAPSMERILDASGSAQDDAVRRLWEPMAGMFRIFSREPDYAALHRFPSFGFPLDERADEVRAGLDALRRADAWGRIEVALARGAAALEAANPGLTLPDVTVLLALGHPGDTLFTQELSGIQAMGGISGYVQLTLWPTPQVLDRLETLAVHELHHNVRYCPSGVVWDPATVTLGEQIVAEGLADRFAAELYPESPAPHVADPSLAEDDDLFARVVGDLGETGMHRFTSWVHGDAVARRFGAPVLGVPTWGGYVVGDRLAADYLAESGRTAAQAVHDLPEEVLRVGQGRSRR